MILDLFAGPGGWSEGLRMLGMSDVGIEKDAAACQTRAAAGHLTIRADIAEYPAQPFAGRVEGLIASPPCQDFSPAGNRAGRTGEKGQLVDVVPLWVAATNPRWVACEQVAEVQPIWDEHAAIYRRLGYSVWTGVLNAANFGVPQSRKRAVLVASLDGVALPPEPTHAKRPEPGLFGTLAPWVSMREALDLHPEVVALRYERGAGMNERHGDRPDAPVDRPAPTITCSGVGGGGAGTKFRWVVSTGDHSQTARGPEDFERSIDRVAPTVLGAKFEGAWFVHNAGDRDEAIAGTEPGLRLTLDQAAKLQTFVDGYPFQGGKGKRAEQIGNAVPPLLAAHVIGAITGKTLAVAA